MNNVCAQPIQDVKYPIALVSDPNILKTTHQALGVSLGLGTDLAVNFESLWDDNLSEHADPGSRPDELCDQPNRKERGKKKKYFIRSNT